MALAKPEVLESRYYFRFKVKDEEGVLAKISHIMAGHHISFATVKQKALSDGSALIMATTHLTQEASVYSACEEIKNEAVVIDLPIYLRIFDPQFYLN